MRIGILLIDIFLVLTVTFIYCSLRLSSKASKSEEEN